MQPIFPVWAVSEQNASRNPKQQLQQLTPQSQGRPTANYIVYPFTQLRQLTIAVDHGPTVASSKESTHAT